MAKISETAGAGPFASKLTSPAYIVVQTDEVMLNFTHSYSFQNSGHDAGQVRFSVNGGPFNPIPAENFITNGYPTGVIAGSGLLQGQRGFTGDSGLITSSAVLGHFNQNDKIAVQFVGAWDASSGARESNWQIQNVQLVFGKVPRPTTFQGQAVASLYGQERGLSYQWQRQDGTNWIDIADANSTTLRFFPTAAAFQMAVRLAAFGPGKTVYSRPVKLTTSPIIAPTIEITSANGKTWITFNGTLQVATQVDGPYGEVSGAISPYAVPNTHTVAFFRCVH